MIRLWCVGCDKKTKLFLMMKLDDELNCIWPNREREAVSGYMR